MNRTGRCSCLDCIFQKNSRNRYCYLLLRRYFLLLRLLLHHPCKARGLLLRHYYLLLRDEPVLRDVVRPITTYYYHNYPLLHIANPRTCIYGNCEVCEGRDLVLFSERSLSRRRLAATAHGCRPGLPKNRRVGRILERQNHGRCHGSSWLPRLPLSPLQAGSLSRQWALSRAGRETAPYVYRRRNPSHPP